MKVRGCAQTALVVGRPGRGAGSGFSLIEVLVAVLIFAIGALAVAQLQLSATKQTQAAANRQIATNLARQLLEAVEAATYTDAGLVATGGTDFINPPASFSPTNPLNSQGEAPVGGPGRFFTRQWRVEVTGAADPLLENYKTVRVRVSWNQAGRAETVELVTVKAWSL